METDYSLFQPYPKTPRLFRDIIITEKLDGTNAQIVITLAPPDYEVDDPVNVGVWLYDGFLIRAGSRNRWITPTDDNYGFAKWVLEHKTELVKLGPGRHFGEWWGGGIQRGYGLAGNDKRFSLFNVARWADGAVTADKFEKGKLIPGGTPLSPRPACCSLVPVLYRGAFDTLWVNKALANLRFKGSAAVPGYNNPEGIVVFHTAANKAFKVLLENDEQAKGDL